MLERVWKKRVPSSTVGGNVNWCNPYGKVVWRYLRRLNVKLPYDQKIPLLGIYPDKTFLEKDTCTHMFTAVFFPWKVALTLHRIDTMAASEKFSPKETQESEPLSQQERGGRCLSLQPLKGTLTWIELMVTQWGEGTAVTKGGEGTVRKRHPPLVPLWLLAGRSALSFWWQMK